MIQVENGGQSWYNGLVVQLRKRMSHGLEGSVAYTWSHAIDNGNLGGGTNSLFYDTPVNIQWRLFGGQSFLAVGSTPPARDQFGVGADAHES